MKQDKQELINEIDNMIVLGAEFSKKVISENKNEIDTDIGLKEKSVDIIKAKREILSGLDEKKSEIISKIIGQMYNGTLVKDKISIRKGEVFAFRCRYPLSLAQIKESILNNLQEVEKKLSLQNLEVLDYILQRVYINPLKPSNSYYYNSTNDSDTRTKIIPLQDMKILEKQSSKWREDKEYTNNFSIHKINAILIDDEGAVRFFYKTKDKTSFPNLNDDTFAGLYFKYEKDILSNADLFIQNLDKEIISSRKEIDEIRQKGQNQLALCELTKETK